MISVAVATLILATGFSIVEADSFYGPAGGPASSIILSASDSQAVAAVANNVPLTIDGLDSVTIASDEADLTAFINKRTKVLKTHKVLAFTTGGLLLAADAMGTYHFVQMTRLGHAYRDSIGYRNRTNNGNGNSSGGVSDSMQTLRTNEIKYVWQNSSSQTERVIHAGLIAAACATYTACATTELSTFSMSRSTSGMSNTKLHRGIFYLHAAGMIANVALGFVESRALAAGNHNVVLGAGVAHLVIGYALPVIMVGSGLVFRISANDY